MHSNITKKCFLAFFNYIWMPTATTLVPCKQERIVSIACAEGRQLPYPSVCQYLCTFPSPLTPTLGSKRLCLAQAVPRALQECLWAGSVPERPLLAPSPLWSCSLDPWEPWASARCCLPGSPGQASARAACQQQLCLWSREGNLAFALPWSYLSEFPMTVSSKGPNSS